jgi:ribosomal protein S28E/S33
MCGIGVEKKRNSNRILVKNLKGIVKFEDLSMDVLLLRWFIDT